MDRLGPWPVRRRIAVAVSGGADSLCLAWLARGWGEPVGLIVDHGLRPDSAEEARTAAARLAGFGVPARVLTLSGLAPGSGLAARARAARYAALTQAAREDGVCDLLLGHHAGDQAETLLIRRESGSGLFGCAGMAAVTETGWVRLVRPLLGVAQGRLRATLRAERISWADDPSNRNPAAGRTRARRALNDPNGNGPATRSKLGEMQVAGHARGCAEAAIAARLAGRASIYKEGYAVLTAGPIEPESLGALIRMLGGAAYPPPRDAVLRLLSAGLRGTLGGVRLMAAGRLGAGTLLVRERAAMQPTVQAHPGCVWDGRYRLDTPVEPPAGASIGALGAGAGLFRKGTPLVNAILATLPAVYDQHGLVAVPHLGYFNKWTNPQLRLRLNPAAPAAGACFQVFAGGCAYEWGTPCPR